MAKRGQITLFIILGITVLLVSGIFIAVTNKSITKPKKEEIDLSPIQTYAQSCLKNVAEEALFEKLGKQGGYISPEIDALKYEEVNGQKISFHYINGKAQVPSVEKIKSQLDSYITENFESCLDLSRYREFSTRKPESTKLYLDMNDDKVIVRMGYPLELSRGDARAFLPEINTEMPIRIKKARDIGECFVSRISEDRSELNIFLAKKNCNNDEMITVNFVSNKYVLIYDYNTWYNKYGQTFKYQFAMEMS